MFDRRREAGGGGPGGRIAGNVLMPGRVVVATVEAHTSRRRHVWGVIIIVVLLAVVGGPIVWQITRPIPDPPLTYEEATTKARHDSTLWRYDDAIATLEEYLTNLPAEKRNTKEHHEATMSLAKAYYDNKQYGQAISRYEELLKSNDYKLDAQRGLGKTYAAKGDKARARQYLEQVVATMKTRTDPESQFRITMDEAELNAVKQ